MAVMNQAGHYNYSNAATLFTLSDMRRGRAPLRNRLDNVFYAKHGENGAARLEVKIVLHRPDKGERWRRRRATRRTCATGS